MTRRLHAVQRTPTALIAVTSDVGPDGRLEVFENPIVSGDAVFHSESALVEAFARLASVRALDDEVRADVSLVLEGSVGPVPIRPIPRFAFDAPVVAPRASAAHPRAFRGTKEKPPKAARPNAVDVRPMLCHPSSSALLVSRLGLQATAEPPHWFGPLFARAVNGPGAAYARRVLGLATRYGLAEDVQLAAWCARLILVHEDVGFAWFEVLERVAAHLKLALVRIVARRAVLARPDVVGQEVLDLLTSTDDVSAFERLFGVVLAAHADGVDPLFVMTALQSQMRCSPWAVSPITRIESFADDIPQLLDVLVPDDEPYDRLDLLNALVRVRGLAALARSIPWPTLDRERTIAMRTLFVRIGHCDAVSDAQVRCRVLSRSRRLLVETLCALGDARVDAFSADLCAVLDALASERRLDEGIDDALRLLARLGRSGARHGCGTMLASVFRLPEEDRALALAAPDSSLELVIEASGWRNDRTLYAYGLNALALTCPSLLARALCTEASALLRAAKWLGALEYDTRMNLLRTLATHAILERHCADHELSALVALIDDAAGRDAGIIPRALRMHLAGDAFLKAGQLARHTRNVVTSLDRARLRFLERAATTAQLAAIGLPDTALAHRVAAAHAAAAHENRRPVRRMLRAYLEGDRDYVLRHPTTAAWKRHQQGLDVDAWLACSLADDVETPRGRVRLAVEHDPLEALKLGTYVGTCLGLGGGLTYSAAAVVLDANKHVIYARTQAGEVVARQLVAIADSGRLVAYAVYGDAALELDGAFRAFDEALANLVGSSLVSDDDYFVPTILARGFWDDGRIQDHETIPSSTSTAPRPPLDAHAVPRSVKAEPTA